MKVVDIENKRKHSIVRFENERKFIIEPSLLKKYSIEVNSDIDIFAVLDDNEEFAYEYALNYAFKLLAISAKTRKEMKSKLYDKFVQTSAVNSVLERLEELGYINDESFARDFVAYKKESGHSRRAITSKLKEKGVDETTINEALADYTDEDESEFAAYFALKIAEKHDTLDYEKLKNKIYSRLASKGFNNNAIFSALDRVKQQYNSTYSDKDALMRSAAKMSMRGMSKEDIYDTLIKKSNSKEYADVISEVIEELFA